MIRLSRLTRAEYIWQPAQLPRRLWRSLTRVSTGQSITLSLPWEMPISVVPHESIGRSIVALNVHDLTTTESIWRLLDSGETSADIGANIGYMTSVMAARLRECGTIHSFEPVPQLAERLSQHVQSWRGLSRARIHVHAKAVSDRNTPTRIYLPAGFENNHGLASLESPSDLVPSRSVLIDCCTLDDIFQRDWSAPAFIKADVEGWEAGVFRGAQRLLSHGLVRDVVFEEHRPHPAEAASILHAHGYKIFRIARGLLGPRLVHAESELPREIDPPSYLATLDPARAVARFQPCGWFSLRTPTPRRGQPADQTTASDGKPVKPLMP